MKALGALIFLIVSSVAAANTANQSESKPLVLPDFSKMDSASSKSSTDVKLVKMQSDCMAPKNAKENAPIKAMDFERCMAVENQPRVDFTHK